MYLLRCTKFFFLLFIAYINSNSYIFNLFACKILLKHTNYYIISIKILSENSYNRKITLIKKSRKEISCSTSEIWFAKLMNGSKSYNRIPKIRNITQPTVETNIRNLNKSGVQSNTNLTIEAIGSLFTEMLDLFSSKCKKTEAVAERSGISGICEQYEDH